jgi:dCTP deaminase
MTIIDPKRFDDTCLVDATLRTDEDGAEYVILPPNSYLLGYTVEYFRMPRDVTAIFLAKSTYARAGISVNATPAEAGWEGELVLEIANQTPLPVKIYVNEGAAQALFFKGDAPCSVSYADRSGKYQGQRGIQLAKV